MPSPGGAWGAPPPSPAGRAQRALDAAVGELGLEVSPLLSVEDERARGAASARRFEALDARVEALDKRVASLDAAVAALDAARRASSSSSSSEKEESSVARVASSSSVEWSAAELAWLSAEREVWSSLLASGDATRFDAARAAADAHGVVCLQSQHGVGDDGGACVAADLQRESASPVEERLPVSSSSSSSRDAGSSRLCGCGPCPATRRRFESSVRQLSRGRFSVFENEGSFQRVSVTCPT